MRWEREGYLRLIIRLKLKIDESAYPFDKIKAPKWLRKEELKRVIEGWESGLINWIAASDDDIEGAKRELSTLTKDKTVELDDRQHRSVGFSTSIHKDLSLV